MKVAMMQPTFLPWQGYFELIHQSDRFVLGDDSQYSVSSYHQRNRLFVEAGKVVWYTVPVQKKESFGMALNRARTSDDRTWREKMWRQIRQNYAKAAYFAQVAPPVERWLLAPAESLAALNIGFIRLACELMGLRREFRLASELPMTQSRSGRVLELLRWCEADQYYCARGSFGYMQAEGLFPVEGIEVFFQNYVPRPYPQVGAKPDFVPYLSVLDALLNVGPEATLAMIAHGTGRWSTWSEMAAAGAVHAVNEDEPLQECL